MDKYIAVMQDELGDEFSVSIDSPHLSKLVMEWAREEYPESRVLCVVRLGEKDKTDGH